MRKATEGSAIEELDVERLDGVDDPATKRAFILMKSTDSDEMATMISRFEKSTKKLLKCLSDDPDGVTPDVMKVAKSLAGFLEEDLTFKARVEKAAAPAPAVAAAVATPAAAPAQAGAAPIDISALAKSISDAVTAGIAPIQKSITDLSSKLSAIEKAEGENLDEVDQEEEEGTIAKAMKAGSKQAAGATKIAKAAPKKLGEGLFANVFCKN